MEDFFIHESLHQFAEVTPGIEEGESLKKQGNTVVLHRFILHHNHDVVQVIINGRRQFFQIRKGISVSVFLIQRFLGCQGVCKSSFQFLFCIFLKEGRIHFAAGFTFGNVGQTGHSLTEIGFLFQMALRHSLGLQEDGINIIHRTCQYGIDDIVGNAVVQKNSADTLTEEIFHLGKDLVLHFLFTGKQFQSFGNAPADIPVNLSIGQDIHSADGLTAECEGILGTGRNQASKEGSRKVV